MQALEHAARRHGPIVYAVNDFCNRNTNNAQAKFTKMFEDGRRDAFVCLFPEDGQWWVNVIHEDEHVVTIFPRENAKSLQDMIDYLLRAGYTQL